MKTRTCYETHRNCNETCNQQPGHTPGAIRAARAIQAQIGIPGTVDAIASIIDQETAAPDLLEALQIIVEYFAALDEMRPKTNHGNIGASVREVARAAIAKAKGRP